MFTPTYVRVLDVLVCWLNREVKLSNIQKNYIKKAKSPIVLTYSISHHK